LASSGTSELGPVNLWEDEKRLSSDKNMPLSRSLSEEERLNEFMRRALTERDQISYDIQGLLSRDLLKYFGIHKDHAVGLCQRERDKRFIQKLRWHTIQDPQRGLYARSVPIPELVKVMLDECTRDGGELTAVHIAE
jgi:hypothetical protein